VLEDFDYIVPASPSSLRVKASALLFKEIGGVFSGNTPLPVTQTQGHRTTALKADSTAKGEVGYSPKMESFRKPAGSYSQYFNQRRGYEHLRGQSGF